MKFFAVSDLHLPGSMDKTMDKFGVRWQGHWDRIREDWLSRVSDDDVVLIAGDISWAMALSDAVPDLLSIAELPGKKILLRGNHDYWWSSITKVRSLLPENTICLQNDAVRLGRTVICGTRGWMETDSPEDKKIFARERIRLDLTLDAAEKLRQEGDRLIVMMHYPPLLGRTHAGEFVPVLEAHRADVCVYGHLHGVAPEEAEIVTRENVRYILSSCDMIGFRLREIEE